MPVLINCNQCNIEISKTPSEFKRYKNHFCSKVCHDIFQNKEVIFICEYCQKTFSLKKSVAKRNKKHYCSKSCLAKQKWAKSDPKNKKELPCKICGISMKVSARAYEKQGVMCSVCRKTYQSKWGKRILTKNCKKCDVKYEGKRGSSYCAPCLHIQKIGAGLASVKASKPRSKIEIMFAARLQELFPYEMFFNIGYFEDGYGKKWDADIIIPDLKLAIHWNGPWHYRVLCKHQNLLATQKRDINKYALIEEHGFRNYIIKDESNANQRVLKVEMELATLKKFIDDLLLNTCQMSSNIFER